MLDGTVATVARDSDQNHGLKHRFRLRSKIASGTSATVYEGREQATARELAVKVLRRDATLERVRRFATEGILLERLDHRNCARVVSHGQFAGERFVALERIHGTALSTVVGRAVDEATVLKWAVGMLRGVAHVHARGLIHRDLKPDNVMLRHGDGPSEDQPVLVDFGTAKAVIEHTDGSEDAATLTLSGLMSGTPAYMSPEQAMGARVDVRTDLYSIGMIVFELLAGHRAYRDDDPVALLQRHITGNLPRLHGIRLEVVDFVERLCARCRRDRFSTAEQALEALEMIRANHSARPTDLEDVHDVRGLLDIAGGVAAALVDYEHGTCIQHVDLGTFDVVRAAVGNVEVVRAKLHVMELLGTAGAITDILITLREQWHLIRPLPGCSYFAYLVVDRAAGNLAMARRKLAALSVESRTSSVRAPCSASV